MEVAEMSIVKEVGNWGRGMKFYVRAATISGLNTCWEEIFDMATRHTYEKDSIIPHAQLGGIYYLASGAVSIFYVAHDGQERLTLRIKPGCLFNEARTFAQCNPEGVFYCTKKSIIWRFPNDLLQDESFITAYPRHISNLLWSMGVKMLIHYTFLADMGVGNHESHVCRFIFELSQCHNTETRFPCPMTQKEMASLLGIHRTTLLRIIHKLRRKGIIARFTQREVIILDLPQLKRLAMLA